MIIIKLMILNLLSMNKFFCVEEKIYLVYFIDILIIFYIGNICLKFFELLMEKVFVFVLVFFILLLLIL